jgi:anti-sigma regulatory factor (Ser/Thr protein kinase)
MAAARTQTSLDSPVPQVRLELRSNALLLAGARELVAAVAKRLGFGDEACGQIALAVDEALCNVIRHGYNREPNRPIWLNLFALGNGWDQGGALTLTNSQYPEAIKIVIEDEAPQVDPAEIKSRDLDQVRPGGLGVHIIRSVMDQAVYERREKVGMRLTMIKNRTIDANAPAAGGAARAGSSCTGGTHG